MCFMSASFYHSYNSSDCINVFCQIVRRRQEEQELVIVGFLLVYVRTQNYSKHY